MTIAARQPGLSHQEDMDIKRNGSQPLGKGPTDRYTGTVVSTRHKDRQRLAREFGAADVVTGHGNGEDVISPRRPRGGPMLPRARSSRTVIADLDGSAKFLQNPGRLWE